MGATSMEVIDVTELMKRRFVWDVLPCPMVPEFIPRMGLVGASDGGNAIEHRESHTRLNRIGPIHSTVASFSKMAATAAAKAILDSQGIDIDGDSDPKVEHYVKLVSTCTAAVIANLIDNGAIRINEGVAE